MNNRFIYMGVAMAAVGIAGAFFLFGSGTRPVVETVSLPATTIVPFTKLVRGTKSSVTTRTNYLITSTTELSGLWKMIDATGTPPTVDFKTSAVLAVFAGTDSNAAITVAKIEDTNARMVSIVIAKPSSPCGGKIATVSPYELVAVPATSLPLTHKDISATTVCQK